MAQCKTAITPPVLTYWSYCSLVLSHRNAFVRIELSGCPYPPRFHARIVRHQCGFRFHTLFISTFGFLYGKANHNTLSNASRKLQILDHILRSQGGGSFQQRSRAHKSKSSYILTNWINLHLSMYGWDIFVRNFKGYLWNSTQNILPINWMMYFYTTLKILEPLDLRARKRFWNAPQKTPYIPPSSEIYMGCVCVCDIMTESHPL